MNWNRLNRSWSGHWTQRSMAGCRALMMQRLTTLAQELVDTDACQSDDQHVIALARISGARLLFSNDADLMRGFRNQHLLRPRGRLLPPGGTRNARQSRQRLFNEPDLCPEIRI